jgi:hypothetical protein
MVKNASIFLGDHVKGFVAEFNQGLLYGKIEQAVDLYKEIVANWGQDLPR